MFLEHMLEFYGLYQTPNHTWLDVQVVIWEVEQE
jgi:hypothetical protein